MDPTGDTFRTGWNVREGHFPADLLAVDAEHNTYSTSDAAWEAEDPGQASYIILG